MQTSLKQLARKCLGSLPFDPYVALEKGWGRYLRWKASPGKNHFRKDGVSLFFDVNGLNSLSKVGRDFTRKISDTTIPFSVIDTARLWNSMARIPVEDARIIAPFISRKAPFKKAIALRCPEDTKTGEYDWYSDVFYEFSEGLLNFRPNLFQKVRGVCVFSKFCEKIVRDVAPDDFPIYYFRYPFIFPDRSKVGSRTSVRAKFGIPRNAFTAFFNFDYRSSMERKNPQACIMAFSKAFKGRKDAFLVFKTSGADVCSEDHFKLTQFAAAQGIRDQIIFINSYLSEQDITDLTAAMDVYLSLHRGEGLGLGMLEAMALNVPVIASAYGGNTEFTMESTAFPVPCEIVSCHPTTPAMAHAKKWADPDIVSASESLKQVYGQQSLARKRAAKGCEFVRDFYSLANFEKSVYRFLDEPDFPN